MLSRRGRKAWGESWGCVRTLRILPEIARCLVVCLVRSSTATDGFSRLVRRAGSVHVQVAAATSGAGGRHPQQGEHRDYAGENSGADEAAGEGRGGTVHCRKASGG